MIDPISFLSALAVRRPVFHSKADLLHELAWHARSRQPDLAVRFGIPAGDDSSSYLDVVLKIGPFEFAMEIKYCTRQLLAMHKGEGFRLHNQISQGMRFSDFVLSARRIEKFVSKAPGRAGIALLLTNDPTFWETEKEDALIMGAYHVPEPPSALRERYRVRWRSYSKLNSYEFGEFRYLLIPVGI